TRYVWLLPVLAVAAGLTGWALARAQQSQQQPPAKAGEAVAAGGGATEDFASVMAKMKGAQAGILKKEGELLAASHDLENRASKSVMMSGGRKPIQTGVRVLLPDGMTWEKLAAMSPEDIKKRGLYPAGFLPLPHENHDEGGMIFPKFHIDEIK